MVNANAACCGSVLPMPLLRGNAIPATDHCDMLHT